MPIILALVVVCVLLSRDEAVMGQLLREVLRTLCGVNQWCYAVFWKTGCQNPKLLIWDECYYENRERSVSSSASRIENPQSPYGEHWTSDIHSSQLGVQAWDTVQLLMSIMMTTNQVNILGEGLVGRAAFTGNHEWILVNKYLGDAHPPEVLSEVHQQFSTGMQTVAVIPVSPHGVVQLGSDLVIMENMGFVNNVKSLIMLLGCDPGLLPSNHTARESMERIGMSIPPRIPVSKHLSGNYETPTSTTAMGNGCNQQSFSSHASVVVGQSCSGSRHSEYSMKAMASMTYTSSLTKPLAPSCNHKLKITPPAKLDDPLGSQLENGVVGAEVLLSNHDSRLIHQVASSNSRQVLGQPGFGQADANINILTLSESQMFSVPVADNNIRNTTNASCTKPCIRIGGHGAVSPQVDSLAFGIEVHHGLLAEMSTSIRCPILTHKLEDISNSSLDMARVGFQNIDSSMAEQVTLSTQVDQLNSTVILPAYSDQRYSLVDVQNLKDESVANKERMDDVLLEALNVPVTQFNKYRPADETTIHSVHNYSNGAIGNQSTSHANAKYENQCTQLSSGDDLYDLLEVDHKKKILNGNLHISLVDGPSAKLQDMANASALRNMQESTSLYSLGEEMTDSCLFSLSGTDHLLEAVVSRVCSDANQRLDDSFSCQTTLMKVSNSSVPSGSTVHGQGTMALHVRKELYDTSMSLKKAGAVASSSYRSRWSKDNIGCSSQTTSFYGSQLSSSNEQGHNLRRGSSISAVLSKKNGGTSKPRLKPGENLRPRPKDRQMIQDRVKELRDIVPNGAKCSIDALLERTVKHMLFLQSVMKHAEKLEQTGDPKSMSKGGFLLKENFEGGATWAFEVGSRSVVCPIIVEDLNPPRQLLVEILCEERGFFLEIAELIRGLGLTILKGVMETQSDEIWARFAVEANRDVTRMEIFMSLVQLLLQTTKGGAAPANAMENKNTMVTQAFSSATSIPATGRPISLQ